MLTRLQPKEITGKQRDISEKKTEIAAEEETHKTNVERNNQLEASILDTKELLDKLSKEANEVRILIREGQRKIFYLKDLIKNEEAILAEDDHIKKVDALFEEQIGFYEMVKNRLKKKQEDLLEGMESFLSFRDPELVVKELKRQATSQAFGSLEIEVRETKTDFEQAQRILCEQKIQGRNSPPSEAIALRNRIDVFLDKPVILSAWSNG
jgi:chromosome segregation ATPase